MKNLSRLCPELFKSQLACAFLIAQLVFCAIVFDWSKEFSKLEKHDEKNCHLSIDVVSENTKSDSAPSFGFYDTYGSSPEPSEIVSGFFFLFSFPTVIITAIFTEVLRADNPQWCDGTIDFMGTIAFITFNSVYWMLLAHLIEKLHDHYLKIRSEPEKPFTIFSDSD